MVSSKWSEREKKSMFSNTLNRQSTWYSTGHSAGKFLKLSLVLHHQLYQILWWIWYLTLAKFKNNSHPAEWNTHHGEQRGGFFRPWPIYSGQNYEIPRLFDDFLGKFLWQICSSLTFPCPWRKIKFPLFFPDQWPPLVVLQRHLWCFSDGQD